MKPKTSLFGKKYIICYTLLFGLLYGLLAGCFAAAGKSMIGGADAFSQHLTALTYYGEWLRRVAHTLFVEHSLQIPLWEDGLGYGADVLATLHYYCIGDPLNLLSALVPARHTQVLYGVLFALRLYLAGLAFSLFSLEHGNTRAATLTAAALYVFCLRSVGYGLMHPYFLGPLIYLPLLLTGVDRVFKNNRPTLYIAALALAAFSNFYFLYSLGIFTVLYAVLVFLSRCGLRGLGHAPKLLGRFALYSAVGLALAGVVLVPVVGYTLGSPRLGAGHPVPMHYSLDYYCKAVAGYAAQLNAGSNNMQGYTALALLCAAALFAAPKRQRPLKAALAVLLAFGALPLAGWLLNGASYVSNRWNYALALAAAFAVARMLPELTRLSRRQKYALAGTGAAWLIIAAVGARTPAVAAQGALLLLLLAVLLPNRLAAPAKRALTAALGCAAVAANLVFLLLPVGDGFVQSFVDAGGVYEKMTDVPAALLADTDAAAGGTARYSVMGGLENKNAALVNGSRGIGFYFSLSNPAVSDYFEELEVYETRDYAYSGVDGRTAPLALAGAKYYVARPERDDFLPGLYQNTQPQTRGDYLLYTDPGALGLSWTCPTVLSRAEYEALSPLQKQQALLQCAVADGTALPQAQPAYTETVAPCTLTPGDGMEVADATVTVTAPDQTLTLDFALPPAEGVREYYLVVEGLTYTGRTPEENVQIRLMSGGVARTLDYATPYDEDSCGRNSFAVLMDCSDENYTQLKMKFATPGVYTFRDLYVAVQPVAPLLEARAQLGQTALAEIERTANTLTGEITLDQSRMLCIGLPYSTGWTATVDGEAAPLLRCDTMYMGLELAPGTHTVQLRYRTPLLNAGILCTLAGVLALAALALFNKRKHNKTEEKS